MQWWTLLRLSDKKSFNNEIRCLREALKRNECDKENTSQGAQPRKKEAEQK